MNAKYPVRWKSLWRSLAIYMTVAILVPLPFILIFRYISTGFDYSEAFENISFFWIPLLVIGICVFSIVFSGLIAVWFKIATVETMDDHLHGRNMWGIKRRIPFHDITSFSDFSNNGIDATIVKSRYHGSVLIYEYTENRDELLEFLRMHANTNTAEQGAAANP